MYETTKKHNLCEKSEHRTQKSAIENFVSVLNLETTLVSY